MTKSDSRRPDDGPIDPGAAEVDRRERGTQGDRVVSIRVRGMRSVRDVTLDVAGLTVLIGDNGGGKSTLLEACELLRRAASSHEFLNQFHHLHGGFTELRSEGADSVALSTVVDGEEGRLEYDFTIAAEGHRAYVIESEALRWTRPGARAPVVVIERSGKDRSKARVLDEATGELVEQSARPDGLVAAHLREHAKNRAVPRIVRALGQIDVQIPFYVGPLWAQREWEADSLGRVVIEGAVTSPQHTLQTPLRTPVTALPAKRLQRRGLNLVNAYLELRSRSEDHWQETLEYVRLGLGEDVAGVVTPPAGEATPGKVTLWVTFKNKKNPVPAYALSDGMLAYLGFVALLRLEAETSLLAVEEPETHLNPKLLMRVLEMLELMSERFPVVVTTHSDRLLDALTAPASSIVVCELDPDRNTRLKRPDPSALDAWLRKYGGFGSLRQAGYSDLTLREHAAPRRKRRGSRR